MTITIESFEDEVGLVRYATPRMELLSIIDTGVYPNAKLLLTKFAKFNARLAPGGDLAPYKEHDTKVTAQIRPYTPTIVQNLSVVIQIFEGIAPPLHRWHYRMWPQRWQQRRRKQKASSNQNEIA